MVTTSPAPQTRSLLESVRATRNAARVLAKLDAPAKNAALEAIAIALEDDAEDILAANYKDVQAAEAAQLAKPLIGRLKLDRAKLAGMVAGVRDVAKLADPVGVRQIHRELDEGLVLERLSCPLGVVGIIFEARPDAVTQISALAIKSGNGIILKGGSEATRSSEAIVNTIHRALAKLGTIATDVVQLVTTRDEINAILGMDKEIDLIIPRGSNQLVRYIQNNTRIPVLGHADGICHAYVDRDVDLEQAIAIAVDSKVQYPSACNAIETLLVHRDIAAVFLPRLVTAMQSQGVEIRACDRTRALLPEMSLIPATEEDWSAEYCDLILSVRVVDTLEDAIAHINTYGSRHTETIITQDAIAAQTFMSDVDAAGVFHNCSTRFADGFRYGFGAEVGISTQKMPPRGPVGLEGLVTYKYQLVGSGHIVATYAGEHAKPFRHRNI
ncbi:glutamate-5-semialdehyde dehydrogenase [Pseudanabaena sp. PCC 6802]|uniref:glutamate-5-semialdehyde dehydrogenase n=1 Tax=Pseudanabaena sp. PCC 6802 TaxID=118173 RepID=UPI000346A893|nr:glutamate-5-semialdehyde dehydrogenase [Pseudanabaena sp. PCC 6802]